MRRMRRLLLNIRGQTTTEYALIVGGVGLVFYLMFKGAIQEKLRGGLNLLGDSLSREVTGGPT